MTFFKPEDFIKDNFMTWYEFKDPIIAEFVGEAAAKIANTKLKREGKVVYGYVTKYNSGIAEPYRFYQTKEHPVLGICKEVTALLINIEPIEKCSHPEDKVNAVVVEGWDKTKSTSYCNISEYQCECGAKVKPKEFEEV